MDIVDAQVHIPRVVVDWRPGHPRVTDADAPVWEPPLTPALEAADRDTVLTASLTAMDAAGVGAVVIDEYVGNDPQGRMLPGHEVAGSWRYSHDFSAYAAERYPERFSFLARVGWDDPELDDVVAGLAATAGMRCLRVTPMPWLPESAAFAEGRYGPVFEAAVRHDLPVFVFSNGPDLPKLEQYLRRYAELQFVVDHMGLYPGAWSDDAGRDAAFDKVLELGRRYANLAVKWAMVETFSSETYPYRDMVPYLLSALEVFGRERLLWASDWSQHRLQQSWAQSFWWLLDSDEVSASDKEWILGRSARSLLRWPVAGGPVYFDCAQAHPSIRITGADDEDFVGKMRAHLERWHPPHAHTPRDQLLARAKRSG